MASDDRQALLDFWFGTPGEPGCDEFRSLWFKSTAAFDAACGERFGAVQERAAAGTLDPWAETADGALALVLLLDQFPRNLYRGTPRCFACDIKARAVARLALARGLDLGAGAGAAALSLSPVRAQRGTRRPGRIGPPLRRDPGKRQASGPGCDRRTSITPSSRGSAGSRTAIWRLAASRAPRRRRSCASPARPSDQVVRGRQMPRWRNRSRYVGRIASSDVGWMPSSARPGMPGAGTLSRSIMRS